MSRKVMLFGGFMILVGIFILLTNGGYSIGENDSISQMEQTFYNIQKIKSIGIWTMFSGLVVIFVGLLLKKKD